jgi:hypothetical protein
MERLVASFTITLAEPILVKDREGAIHTFKVAHDAYQVEITWGKEDVPSRIFKPGSHRPCYGISRLNISVSHPETEPYPEGVDARYSYIEPRLEAYASVAENVTNRLIKYFKFTLGNPLLREIATLDLKVSNPEWTDENGAPLPRALVISRSQLPIGLAHSPAFGIQAFSPAQSHELEKALQADRTYELYEELIADARTALLQRNLRRAVLEMAIACEVATKQLFFKEATLAGDAFEYLEDKSKVNVSVPEFLNKVSKAVFGTGFYDSHKKDWHNIEYLFQCRNKVAHRGILRYNDQHGTPQNVDFETLRDWWDSLDTLIAWIRSK